MLGGGLSHRVAWGRWRILSLMPVVAWSSLAKERCFEGHKVLCVSENIHTHMQGRVQHPSRKLHACIRNP